MVYKKSKIIPAVLSLQATYSVYSTTAIPCSASIENSLCLSYSVLCADFMAPNLL